MFKALAPGAVEAISSPHVPQQVRAPVRFLPNHRPERDGTSGHAERITQRKHSLCLQRRLNRLGGLPRQPGRESLEPLDPR